MVDLLINKLFNAESFFYTLSYDSCSSALAGHIRPRKMFSWIGGDSSKKKQQELRLLLCSSFI
ncbi:unnamed protein product [Brugia pahangi]|uniref:Ovule protein n=1 Tax=Brugia pahangi TaxID=6280 RepID=A0A0N4TQH7_BRUPA|nr:unnamed protein product [Brugia pahangi]